MKPGMEGFPPEELAVFFKAICDPTRQEILLMLEEGERSVSEIVEGFKLSQPTISRHLGVLHQAGLVTRRRSGQKVVYSLKPDSMRCCCMEFFGKFTCCSNFFRKRGDRRTPRKR